MLDKKISVITLYIGIVLCKKGTKKMKNQFGRSMVEMLGVLGLIGLLSIAGIEGYQYAVLRHRSNVVLKMAHQIAADIVNLPGMYQQTANLAESAELADLDFTNKSGMTLPFAVGNMTATKIDGTVFRVNTPPLSEEQCQAVLKYARNYPLILERTFEEENCIGEEENSVGLLYFSLDYGADDLNPTPETPPPSIPSCGLCETFNKDTNQCECTPGICETSDGQKGECSNCACIPDNPVEPPEDGPVACEPACSDGYCCIRTLLKELLCLEDGSTNGQPCEGFNDTSCPTNYACRELDGAFKCVLDCDSTLAGGGAAGGVVSCLPDEDYEKPMELFGKEWTAKSNKACEESPDNKYKCSICPLAGYCSRYSMSTPDGCGCPDNVYYGTGRDRECCVDGDGNVGQVPDNYRYEYCYPSKDVSSFWCQDRVGSFPGFCCPEGAREKKLGETPISSDTIQSAVGNLYYSLKYCVCPENTVFNPDANNGYGACVECIEEGYISDGMGNCCNPNDDYYDSGCLCTLDYLKNKCENDNHCVWEISKEKWLLGQDLLFVDGDGLVRVSDAYHEGTCITCDLSDDTWCELPGGCCPCHNLVYEKNGQLVPVNKNGECNLCPEEYISGYTPEQLAVAVAEGEGKVEVKVNSSLPDFTGGICLKCDKYGGVWVPGSEYTKNSYCVFCPKDRPKWNDNDKKCEKCPDGAPLWNDDKKECEPCPEKTPVWDGNKCVTCSQSDAKKPYWNEAWKQCDKCPDQTPAWNGDKCVTCYDLHGPEEPYWNGNKCVHCYEDEFSGGEVWSDEYDENGSCISCYEKNSLYPLWNDDWKQCEECPAGTVFDSGSCIGDPSAFCPEEAGYYWDHTRDCCWNPYMGWCEPT